MCGILNKIEYEIRNNLSECNNLYLLFNCYIEWEKERTQIKPKNIYLRELMEKETKELDELLKNKVSRQKKLLKALKSEGYNIRFCNVSSISPVAVGMGNPNPFENGLTFQQPYGYPIIPGSAQKGISLMYARDVLNLSEERCTDIFGDEEKKGSVIFFDAIPLKGSKIFKVDIMNPHYSEYYGTKGKIPPADYLSPVPILFMTVKKGIKFMFSMASLNNENLNEAWECLKNGVFLFGIGGKTHVGYGRFNKDEFERYE